MRKIAGEMELNSGARSLGPQGSLSGEIDMHRTLLSMSGMVIVGLVVALIVVLETAPGPQEKAPLPAKSMKRVNAR